MPVDYSKWDNLELSDDEDFDCHPNVDKASMVRWKQADIHRKRLFRKAKINASKREVEYINKLISIYEHSKPGTLALKPTSLITEEDADSAYSSKDVALPAVTERKQWDDELRKKYIDEVLEGWEGKWGEPEFDPFIVNNCIRFEFLDVGLKKEDIDSIFSKNVKDRVLTPYESLKKRRELLNEEIIKEEKELNKKLTMDNMHEGFSSTRIVKDNTPVTSTTGSKSKVIETIHAPSNEHVHGENCNHDHEEDDEEEDDDDEIKDPALIKYIKYEDLTDAYNHLLKNKQLVNQGCSDQVLAQAFREGLNFADKTETYQPLNTKEKLRITFLVRHALILQYCSLLGKDGVEMFFARLKNPNHNASELFNKDSKETADRIISRVNTLNSERKQKEAEENRLLLERLEQCKLPNGEGYFIPGKDSNNPEEEKKAQTFSELHPDFQKGILLEDVNLINAYLASLNKEEAELVVKKCAESNLLNLQLED